MIPIPPIAARVLFSLLALALLWAAWQWADHRGFERGVAQTDAQWADASARMQAATVRAAAAADVIAQQRETEQRVLIQELKDEAAKGNDDAVGPGVAGVLAGLRRQAAGR